MWVFTTGHFGAGAEAAGSLMKKIGVRWSFGWEKIMMEKYNIYPAWLDIFSRRFEPPEKLVEYLKENPQYNFLCVFGETAFSETHFHYFPPELLENPAPRPLNEVEEQKFKQLWEKAITYSEIVRKEFPDKKLIFGNGYPQFIHTFMSRGYPKNLVDGFALDFIGYKMELFFYLKEVAKHYGYDNVPFYITEGFYLGTKQGYYHDRISEQKQADRYIQGFLHGFSLGVEKFLSSSEIWDNSSEYYFTGYGPVGLCHKPPELNPKIGYVAYATMTLLLDRAKFHSKVPAGYVKNDTGAEQFIESANVYALRFDKPEGCVYALWAGPERECTVSFIPSKGTKPYLVDSQSNEFPLTKKQEKLFFKVGSSPVWIVDAGEIQRFYVEETVFNASPGKTAQILVSGETFKDWKVDLQPYPEMEAMNENRPVKSVPDYFILGISGKSTTVRVGEIQNICPYRLLYTVIKPEQPIDIPTTAKKIGIWIYGNGAAQIDLEILDAKGQKMTTVPSPPLYRPGTPYDAKHAFDGWQYFSFDLPENRGQRLATWRGGTEGPPFKLSGLILQQYHRIASLNKLVPPNNPVWMIGNILYE